MGLPDIDQAAQSLKDLSEGIESAWTAGKQRAAQVEEAVISAAAHEATRLIVAAIRNAIQARAKVESEAELQRRAARRKVSQTAAQLIASEEYRISARVLAYLRYIAKLPSDPEGALADLIPLVKVDYDKVYKVTDVPKEDYIGDEAGRPLSEQWAWDPASDSHKDDCAPLPLDVYYYSNLPSVIAASAQSDDDACLDGNGTSSDCDPSFVYLDVGQWGNRLSPRRDFGVSYGRTVLLCRYGESGTTKINGASANDERVLSGFLKALGAVRVEQSAQCHFDSTGPAEGDDVIRVFIGDTHIPVVAMDPTQDASQSAALLRLSKSIPLQMGRVMLIDVAWRIIFDEIDAITGQALSGILKAAGFYIDGTCPDRMRDQMAYILARLAVGATDLVVPGDDAVRRVAAEGAAARVWLNEAGRWDSDHWLKYYLDADDFHDAGSDLHKFVGLLELYNKSSAVKVELVQTGDMVDMWVGMLCHWQQGTGIGMQPDTLWRAPTTEEFTKYWTAVSTALNSNRNIRAISAMHNYSGAKVFLYGNHDNYYGSSALQGFSYRGALARATSHYVPGNLFAEHGHRPDFFNRDGAMIGWLITQTSFYQPSVRPLAPEGRLVQLKCAANTWATLSMAPLKGFRLYVMGHTHAPMLITVHARPRATTTP